MTESKIKGIPASLNNVFKCEFKNRGIIIGMV